MTQSPAPYQSPASEDSSSSWVVAVPGLECWSGSRENRRLQVYTRLYILALFLIAALVIGGHLVLSRKTSEDRLLAEQLAGLGRLQTAARSVFWSAEVLGQETDEADIRRNEAHLTTALQRLRNGLAAVNSTTGTVQSILGTDQEGLRLVERLIIPGREVIPLAETLLLRISESPRNQPVIHELSESMAYLESPLVSAIEDLESHLRLIMVERSAQLGLLEVMITALILALLGAEALVIFRPAGLRIRSIVDRLVKTQLAHAEANRKLQILTEELSERNGELQESLSRIHTLHHALLAQIGPASFGTVARGIASQLENPLRDLRNQVELSLELIADLNRELRLGASRIPLRILDELQDMASQLAQRQSGQLARIEGMESLIAVARRFSPDLSHSPGRPPTLDSDIPVPNSLYLEQFFEEVVAIFRAGGPEMDPPVDPDHRNIAPGERELDIIVECDDSIQMIWDQQAFTFTILELLRNAARATRLRRHYGPAPEGYRRIVGLSAVESVDFPGKVIIRIMDNGVGMTAEVRARSVEPFFSTRPGGLGMGLTYVRDWAIHNMGGSLELTDTPGGGTTVRITLPRILAAQSESAPTP